MQGQADGLVEDRFQGQTAVAFKAHPAGACQGKDLFCGGIHKPDAMVRCIGDVEVAIGVYGYTCGEIQLCVRGRARIATVAPIAEDIGRSPTGDGGDDAGLGIHSPDAVVVKIGDVEVAGCVQGDAFGGQSGVCGRSPVS